MRANWAASSDIMRSWQFKTGARVERLAVLNAAWEKELGHMARHWRLEGVRRGFLYVRPHSPAAALELQMRMPGILRGLNKYFRSGWIKGIRVSRAKVVKGNIL